MRSLNIFTDASIVHTSGQFGTVGCAGYVSAVGEDGDTKLKTLDKYCTILLNTTNNIAEATGVLRAVQYAICQRNNFDQINIFSDSQWCIRSITTWVFGWIAIIDSNGVMYSSNQEPVKNQNLLSEIIMEVVRSGIKLRFFHCKGHVKSDSKSIFEALKTFRNSNYIRREVHLDYNSIYIMAYYNDMIDMWTRMNCKTFCSTGMTEYPIDQPRPFYYILNRDILETYKRLIE